MTDARVADTQRSAAQPTQTAPASSPSVGGGSRLREHAGGGGFEAQAQRLAPIQQRATEAASADVHAAAAHGISGSGGALPHADRIQQSFGTYDLSNVTAHTDSAAAEGSVAMGAEAYATGSEIAFAGAPDLHTAAHEAAHVVQQRAGVSLSGGVGQAGDSYEQHADRAADAVVAGKSAAPILSQMTGGDAASGDVQRRAVQRAASGPPPSPITSGGGGTGGLNPSRTPTGGGTSTNTSTALGTNPTSGGGGGHATAPDPEAEWRTYCATLEPAVGRAATSISDAGKRTAFRALTPVEQRTFAAPELDAALRDAFLAFTRWQDRTAVTVMLASPAHLGLYKRLASEAERTTFRGLTPDERGDLATVSLGEVATLLTNEAVLNRWRTWRNAEAIRGDKRAIAALGVADPNDMTAIGNELARVSSGRAGERMRRLINEQGFEVPVHREHGIRDIANMVRGGMDPWAAMEAAKPSWMLKGRLTKNDGGFRTVPVLKAVPHLTMVQYGVLQADFVDALITAQGQTPDATTRAALLADQSNQAKAGFRAWKASGGVFNPSLHVASYSIEGRGNSGAYWMYSADMVAICDPAVGGQDVIRACAIEESPEYNEGFVIVELPAGDPTLANRVRRPTMWDGLQFDQFAGVDNPAQCFGVTSGGTPEVVVAPTPLASCAIRRNVPM